MVSSIDKSGSQLRPDDKLHRSQLLVWGGASALVLVLMSMIVGAPLAISNGHASFGLAIYKAFSPLCHQISDRSFHIEGHAFAVCARCTGIYAGATAGVIFYPLVRSLKQTDTPHRVWLFLASVPMFVDWALGFTGIWANTHFSRFLTGAVLGAVCALFVMPGLLDMLKVDWRRFFGKSQSNINRNRVTASPLSSDRSAPSDFGSPTSRI